MDGAEFRVLGPVGIWRGGNPVGSLTAQQKTLLAKLLLDSDRVVLIDDMVRAVWGEHPPASARNAVQGHLSKLRRILAAVPEAELTTSVRGYCLKVDACRVDVHLFRDLVARARASDASTASELLRSALGLWRGPALADVAGAWLSGSVGAALHEERMAAVEERAATDIRLGRYAGLIAGLSAAVGEHPLRERSVGLLMTALDRGGRRAEALELFRETRQRLVDDLGIEPSSELQQVHTRILEAAAPPPPTAVVPKQLPADVPGFAGRRPELATLDAVVPIRILSGTAGVGKTTLAVHWAHRAVERFPDGQLFVDMRGFHPGPRMPASEALSLLLVALGLAVDKIPVGLVAQSALYRSLLAGRRVLVVLDNVADPDQVRPLIPGAPGCLLLVTGRDRLSGLVAVDGAHRVMLDVLPVADAIEVLAHAAGPGHLSTDRDAAAELANLCGHLPLALRIAGARLADRPHLGVRRHAEELAARGPLNQLLLDGDASASVRGAFDLSYHALQPGAARVFRLLGLVPAPAGLSVPAIVALTGLPADAVEPLIDAIVRLHLVKATADGRLVCHDLLLAYATGLAEEHEQPADRDATVERLFHFYLRTLDRAATALNGRPRLRLSYDPPPAGVTPVEFTGEVEARRWIATHWTNLIAALDHAAAAGLHPMVWRLIHALRDFLRLHAPPAQWLTVAQTGLTAAQQTGDVLGEAAMRLILGSLRRRTAEFPAAIEEYEAAADLSRRAGWRAGESAAACNTGIALADLGHMRPAIHQFEEALAVDRQIGDRTGEAAMLTNLAAAYEQIGDLSQAARFGELALPLLRQTGQHKGEAIATENLAIVLRQRGHLSEAREALAAAQAICRSIGAQPDEAAVLISLGLVHRDAGRHDDATAALTAGLDIARHLSDSRLELFANTGLASVESRQGRPATAQRLNVILDLAHRTGHHRGKVEALLTLSELHAARGQHRTARDYATEALELARTAGCTLQVAQAHSCLAITCLGLEDVAGCLDHCQHALATQRLAGQRLALARTLLTEGQAFRHLGKVDLAEASWREAHVLFADIGAPERAETAALLSIALTT